MRNLSVSRLFSRIDSRFSRNCNDGAVFQQAVRGQGEVHRKSWKCCPDPLERRKSNLGLPSIHTELGP